MAFSYSTEEKLRPRVTWIFQGHRQEWNHKMPLELGRLSAPASGPPWVLTHTHLSRPCPDLPHQNLWAKPGVCIWNPFPKRFPSPCKSETHSFPWEIGFKVAFSFSFSGLKNSVTILRSSPQVSQLITHCTFHRAIYIKWES